MSATHHENPPRPAMISRSLPPSALMSRWCALVTAVAVTMVASAASAAATVGDGGSSTPIVSVQEARVMANKPPPVNGYRGPNGPTCYQVCVGTSGGSPQRPPVCRQWQTVCN